MYVIVKNDKVEERIVTLGETVGQQVEITSGVRRERRSRGAEGSSATARVRPRRSRTKVEGLEIHHAVARSDIRQTSRFCKRPDPVAHRRRRVAFTQLGVDRFPKVDFPTVVVTTRLPGAAPEEVETEITDKIEEAVNTISAIDELRSNSSEGISQVIISFLLEKDADIAAQEVRDRVNRVLPLLPKTIQQPTVEKFDPDAAPVLTLAVSANKPVRDITEYADKTLRRQLESVNGVGQVVVSGGRSRQINITLDAGRLRAYNLTVTDVSRALQAQNAEIPGGRVEAGSDRAHAPNARASRIAAGVRRHRRAAEGRARDPAARRRDRLTTGWLKRRPRPV